MTSRHFSDNGGDGWGDWGDWDNNNSNNNNGNMFGAPPPPQTKEMSSNEQPSYKFNYGSNPPPPAHFGIMQPNYSAFQPQFTTSFQPIPAQQQIQPSITLPNHSNLASNANLNSINNNNNNVVPTTSHNYDFGNNQSVNKNEDFLQQPVYGGSQRGDNNNSPFNMHQPPASSTPTFFNTTASEMKNVNLTPPMPGLKPIVFEKVKLKSPSPVEQNPIQNQMPNRPPMLPAFTNAFGDSTNLAFVRPPSLGQSNVFEANVKGESSQLNDSLPPPPPASFFEKDNREHDFEIGSKNSPPPPPPSNAENIKSNSHGFDFSVNDQWQQKPPQNFENQFYSNSETPLAPPVPVLPSNPQRDGDMNLENISVAPLQQQQQPPQKYPENKFMMAPAPINKPFAAGPPKISTNFPDTSNMETIYPENRERLDDSVPVNTTDRHNYLVTGQLSQDLVNQPSTSQGTSRSSPSSNNQNEVLPPPGLSRLVVGQTENNQEQPPPGLNRMVTGTEVTNNDYNNLRQADGEVSQTTHVPKSTSSFMQSVHEVQEQINQESQNFSMTDRNSYLVPGESDINAQRGVIPGVESDSSLTNIVAPMQKMKLEKNEDVEEPVNADERNVNVDGENVRDNETRDETIEGANQNPNPNPIKNLTTKSKINYSTEESERNEESLARISRKPKHYDTNDSDSDRVDYHKGKRSSREKTSGREREDEKDGDDDYYKYKRRDKDRNTSKYGRNDRRRRDDFESDGSKYDTERSVREKDRGRSRNSEDDDSRDRRDRYRKSKYRGRDDKDRDLDRTRDRIRDKDVGRDKERDRRDRDRDRERFDRKKEYYGRDRDRDRDRERGRYSRRYRDDDWRSENPSDREYHRRSKDREWRDEKKVMDMYQQPGYGYDYNQMAYYNQHQQYYEHLRRTNPQAYSEWYNRYMASLQAHQLHSRDPTIADGDVALGSVHSGYSSDKERLRGSHQFLPGGGLTGPLQTSSFIEPSDYPSMASQYHLINKQIAEMNHTIGSMSIGQSSIAGDYDNMARKSSMSGAQEAQHRLTPHKFSCVHSLVKLSNGIVTSIDSNEHVFSVKMENIVVHGHPRKMFQLYPGPLIRGVTHKKSIIEFCEEQLKVETVNSMFSHLWRSDDVNLRQANKASYVLLWSYLILLLRQNGNITEADVSELLIKNSEEFDNSNEDRSDRAPVSSKNASNEDNTDESSDENVASNTVSTKSCTEESSAVSEKSILHKFRDFLLYGNIGNALDFATDNNLWGHALFLASKVDRRQHANVMLKFANKLPYNDPLQTLYQVMSGRMPSCVTNLDDKWGDWRPHLAMIVSNCSDKPDLLKRSVTALGDLLANRGDLFGSQFCYLLSDPQFGRFGDDDVSTKIVLLGASHQRSFREFATNESIIMTELFEYARSLSHDSYFIPELQKYKFLLANNMLDHGYQLKCLLYMEQIALRVIQQPDVFDYSFIQKVHDLADRLKFYDPVMEKSYEDNYNNNNALEMIEDQKWLQDLRIVLSETSSRVQYQEPAMVDTPYEAPILLDGYQPEHQQQATFQNIEQFPQQQIQQTADPIPTFAVGEPVNNQVFQPPQMNLDQQNPFVPNYQQQPQQQYQQQDQYSYQESPANTTPQDSPIHQTYQPPSMIPQSEISYDHNNWEAPKPVISLGNSYNSKPTYNNQESVEDQKAIRKESISSEGANKKQEQENKKNGNAKNKGNEKSGWFGGFFNKIVKAPNQMILPDDKNPTIVWDPNEKKWINKDGDGTEQEAFKPPPKMADIMPQRSVTPQQAQQYLQRDSLTPQMPQQQQPSPMHQQIQQQQPQQQPKQPMMQNSNEMLPSTSPSPGPANPPPPNMFKMQKRPALKKSYVDILGNSGHTTAPKAAPLLPAMDNIFNPQQSQGMPQFYNPNDFQ